MSELHALLLRQLRRAGAGPDAPPAPDRWPELLASISRAYRAADDDRYTLERSLELSSAEMTTLYDRLALERDRLTRELEVAHILQTALLPRDPKVPGFEIAGHMTPATEAGGDYYDVISVPSACWFAIGDVAGHGLRAAIVMLMVQSMIATMTRAMQGARPSEILRLVNAALWDGTRNRMRVDEHVTCMLLRATFDGCIEYAGAHETLLVSRAGAPCERIPSTGTWLSVTPDLGSVNVDRRFTLARGDLLVLYTDGVIEARATEPLGLDRLAAAIDERRELPVATLCAELVALVKAWAPVQADDVTIVVIRYRGE